METAVLLYALIMLDVSDRPIVVLDTHLKRKVCIAMKEDIERTPHESRIYDRASGHIECVIMAAKQ